MHSLTDRCSSISRAAFPRTRVRPIALALALLAAPAALIASHPAQAQSAEAKSFSIPAGPLVAALDRYARSAGVNLTYEPLLVAGLTSRGLSGNHRPADGLALLLAGTGLEGVAQPGGGFSLRKLAAPPPPPPAAETSSGGQTLPLVSVTASIEQPGALPKPYSGGQVARGGRVGLLGDKDFLDTPFNQITYTAQTVEDQQARTLAEVMANNPSFRPIFTDNDVGNDFVVRGNRLKSLDIAYGGLYGMTLPGVETVERIEVLSGANALLNGLGPIGGVGGAINMVPKRALDTPLTRLTAGYTSDANFGLRADISRRFGEQQQFGIRVNTSFSDGDLAVDRQGKRVKSFTAALDYRGDGVRINADLGYRKNENRSPTRTTFIGAGFEIPTPPDPRRSWQQPWSYDNLESYMGMLRAEFDLARDVTLYAAAGGSYVEEGQFFSNSQLLASNGNLFTRQVYWPLYRHSHSAETGLRAKFNTGPVKHSINVAASGLWVDNGILINNLAVFNTNIYNPVYSAAPSTAGLNGPSAVPRTGASFISGIAVADTLSFMDDRVQVTLGLRRQSVRTDAFQPTTGDLTTTYDRSVTTPGVGAVFKATNQVSVYANYIEGLQQGPTATAGSVNVGQIFAPYVSKQMEAGVKMDLGRFATTVALYQLKTPNGITDPVSRVYSVSGEQRTRGVEINTFGEVVRGVRLLGGVAFVDAKQTRTAGGVNEGRYVSGAPRFQMNLGTEWDVAALPGFTLWGRAIHSGSQYVDNANLQSIKAATTFDLGARYRTRINNLPTAFRLTVQNVANKAYWSTAVDTYVVQGLPRTVLLSGSVDF